MCANDHTLAYDALRPPLTYANPGSNFNHLTEPPLGARSEMLIFQLEQRKVKPNMIEDQTMGQCSKTGPTPAWPLYISVPDPLVSEIQEIKVQLTSNYSVFKSAPRYTEENASLAFQWFLDPPTSNSSSVFFPWKNESWERRENSS
ncbi:hypothetical protein VNO77_03386 [Canavalia gladiata]|uniref:Uncharacterized protein n=1 Tax=Canavalia gladiata TaxID=3824 RepID=A0AAN9MUN1_CANGL